MKKKTTQDAEASRIGPYTAVAVQPNLIVINDKKEIKKKVLPRYLDLIDHSMEWYGLYGPRVGNPPIRLFTFPEFTFQGWDYYHSPTFASPAKSKYGSQKEGLKVAVEIPGPETDIIGAKAQEYNVYLAIASLEYDPEWPDRFFNAHCIIDPKGDIVHKYRKVNTTNHGIGISTSPYDVLDEYMERYGQGKSITETLFPVTETEIGRIGTYTCYDGMFPEVPRMLAFNGAELLIRAIQWYTRVFPTVGADIFRTNNRMRAADNCCYLISTNSARTINTPENPTKVPEAWACGHSMIIDDYGTVLAEGSDFHEETVMGTIDIDRLRQRRSSAGFNYPAQILIDAYADGYVRYAKEGLCHRPNEPKDTVEDSIWSIERSIKRFYEKGIYVKPPKS